MKYIVHYGYYECEGFKIFPTKKKVKQFIHKQTMKHLSTREGLFFEVFECSDIKQVDYASLVKW